MPKLKHPTCIPTDRCFRMDLQKLDPDAQKVDAVVAPRMNSLFLPLQ